MAAEGHAPTAGEYIVHHLTHWRNKELNGPFDLSVVAYDSIIFSVLMGLIGCFVLWKAARAATSGVPGRFQAAVELLVEMVEALTIVLAVAITKGWRTAASATWPSGTDSTS